jgi:cation transport regulator ChaC
MSDAVWYFGYGSNMCRAIFLERRGMRPLETKWGWLDGHRLCFNLPVGPGERGVANLVAAPGARTCGVLYLLTAEDFERLDRSEGVHVGLYGRVPVAVMIDGRERVSAITYLSTFASEGRKPSARYIGLLLEGARENGLPEEYIRTLEALELAIDERDPAER